MTAPDLLRKLHDECFGEHNPHGTAILTGAEYHLQFGPYLINRSAVAIWWNSKESPESACETCWHCHTKREQVGRKCCVCHVALNLKP